EVEVGRAVHEATAPAGAEEVASLHHHTLAAVDMAGKARCEAVEVPVDRLVAAGMDDHHAVAAVGAGVGDSGGGGEDRGAYRLVGEVVVVAVVAIVLHIALAEIVHDIAVAVIAAVHGGVGVIEVGQMDNADAGRPWLEEGELRTGALWLRDGRRDRGVGRWWLRLRADAGRADLHQLVLEVVLEGLSEALHGGA